MFIVILSKAAFASPWVRDECKWAYNLYKREPQRIILPVTAQPIEQSDFNAWLFLEDFRRVEAPGYRPYPTREAIEQTLDLLTLPPKGKVATRTTPRSGERVRDLVARGKALSAREQYAEALPFLEEAARRAPRNFQAWAMYSETSGVLTRRLRRSNTLSR